MSASSRAATLLGAALAVGACGGQVDLGKRAPPTSVVSLADDTGAAADDPYRVPSERVLPVQAYTSLDTLAVFGEWLYFGLSPNNGGGGLYRCQKRNCERSLARLPGDLDDLHTLRVHEQRLVVSGGTDGWWIGSYALPDATDKQVVIDQLPTWNWLSPLFHRGYAFWSLSFDHSVYRCALPDCAEGPHKIAQVFDASPARADGELIFTLDSGAIQRADKLGDGVVERLQPDATLSEAPQRLDDSDPAQPFATSIETSAGMLYALVNLGSGTCQDGCTTTIARWPVTGGNREDLFVTDERVGGFWVFGSELVWLARRAEDSDRSILSTCRVEACAATLRHLGQVRSELRGIAADSERLYWFQTKLIDPGNFSEVALRSVGLLAAP